MAGASIRRVVGAVANDAAGVLIDNAALVSILHNANVMGFWDARAGSIAGLATDAAWRWRDLKSKIALIPTQADYAPGYVAEDADDGLPYLRFGYGSSGSEGANTLSATTMQNGNLITPHGQQMLLRETGFVLVALSRVPVVGGVAGATPGGYIIGNKLNQSATFSSGTNARWSGLNIGYGGSALGEARVSLNGDARYQDADGGTNDFRDGLWHLHVGSWDYVTPQSMALRIDGAARGASDPSPTATYDISTVRGTTELRVGATGLPETAVTSLEGPFKGDIRLVAVCKYNSSIISQIEDYVLANYSVG